MATDEELGDYGFDSISLTKFANELNDYYNLELLPTVFYNYPTIEKLSDFLIENHPEALSEKYKTSISTGQNTMEVSRVNSPDLSLETSKRPRFLRETAVKSTNMSHEVSVELVAIIGMSCRFPGSADPESFWNNLKENKDLITEVPEERWNWKAYYGDPKAEKGKTKAKWGGFITDADKFDPLFFNISPREAELMDPQQRITLQAVWHALEDAGVNPKAISGSNTGVFIGSYFDDYASLIQKHGLMQEAQAGTGLSQSILANRISYLFNLHGPSEPVDTACSSSLIAIHRAVEYIRPGNCDMVIAGGVSLNLVPETLLTLSQAGMLSEDGRCKTFDQDANGYVRGEGVGIIILKSLSKAEADGDRIYGVIRSTSENHGGKANTLTSPNPNAQAELLLKAYRQAKINPEDVSYIEAHGTGTPLGDPVETEGLKMAFERLYKEHGLKPAKVPHISLGSVKANIGHLEAAAGIAGVIKVILAMKHQMIPGNPQLKTPNTYLKLENTSFRLQKDTTTWTSGENGPRIAGVSSFGFGGVNAHVVIEQYTDQLKIRNGQLKIKNDQLEIKNDQLEIKNGQLKIENDQLEIKNDQLEIKNDQLEIKNDGLKIENDPVIIVLSARNQERLKAVVKNLLDYLNDSTSHNSEFIIHNLAYTLQTGREAMEERLAFMAGDIDELIKRLQNYLSGNNEELLSGNTKKGKADFLLEGEAGKGYIEIAIRNREAKSLAQLWVKGVEIDWNLLYGDHKAEKRPQKISLPGYPFARERYWIPEAEGSTQALHGSTYLHPLLHRNESDLREQKFTSVFTGGEVFFEAHKVKNEKMLPGVAYLEMAREAGVRSIGQQITRIGGYYLAESRSSR